jgi:addiction module HigA family antidote
MSMEMFNPPHPGRVLKDVLPEIPMTISEFAAHIGVSRVTLSRVINGRAGITPEMSIRLSQAFGQPSLDIWFRMQAKYDFWHAKHTRRKKVRPIRMKAKMANAA